MMVLLRSSSLLFVLLLSLFINISSGEDDNLLDVELPVIVDENVADPVALAAAQAALDTARATWNMNSMDQYAFGYHRSCMCLPEFVKPMLVEVDTSGGGVNRVIYQDGSGVVSAEVVAHVPTIEEVFDKIQNAIDVQAPWIDVTYNVDMGYPESVVIDYDKYMADEEYIVTIGSFGPISSWLREVTAARELWNSFDATRYEFLYERICALCILGQEDAPKTIVVENGVVVSVDGNAVNRRNLELSDTPTMPELFDEIETSLESAAFKVTASYDETYGYPLSVFIDHVEMMIGEEVIFRVELLDISFVGGTSQTADGTVTGGEEPTNDESGLILMTEEAEPEEPTIAVADGTVGGEGGGGDTVVDGVVIEDSVITDAVVSEDPSLSSELIAAQSALDGALALWTSLSISRYSFRFQQSCFCDYEFVQPRLITVNGDSVETVVSQYNDPVSDTLTNASPTLMEVFTKIQSAIDQRAASIQVTYNQEYGYPESVYIDYHVMIADEEYSVSVDYLGLLSIWSDDNANAKQLWDSLSSSSLSTYTFSYEKVCTLCFFGMDNVVSIITVQDGVVTLVDGNAVRHLRNTQQRQQQQQRRNRGLSSSSSSPSLPLSDTPTMEDIFQEIENSIQESAFDVAVTYNETYGYPSSVHINYKEMAIGEELILRIQLLETTTTTTTEEEEEGVEEEEEQEETSMECSFEDVSNCEDDSSSSSSSSSLVRVLDIQGGSNIPNNGEDILYNVMTMTDDTTGLPMVRFQADNPFEIEGVDMYVVYDEPIDGSKSGNRVCAGSLDKPYCDRGSNNDESSTSSTASTTMTAHCLNHADIPYATVSIYYVSQDPLFQEMGGDSDGSSTTTVYKCCEQAPDTIGFPVLEYTFEVYCECPSSVGTAQRRKKLLRA